MIDTEAHPARSKQLELNEISIYQLARLLYQDKWLFLVIVFGTVALAIASSFAIAPVYRAETLLVPAETGRGNGDISQVVNRIGGLASLAGVDVGSGSSSDEAIAVLKSREFTYGFITREQLLKKIFSKKWNESSQSWNVEEDDDIPTLEDAYKLINNELRRIVVDRDTGFVTASIEWRDPKLAARWLNSMISLLNETMRQSAIDESQKSISYLNKELDRTSVVELKQAIYGLIESQINSIMLANVRDEYVFKVIDSAVSPEVDDYFWPNRALIAAGSLVFGIFLAGVVILIRSLLYSNPAPD